MNAHLHHAWSRSKAFRVFLVIAVVYAVVRLIPQGVLIAGMWQSGGIEGYDLQLIIDAAASVQHKQDLYPPAGKLERAEFYQYSPAYALAFVSLSWLPLPVLMIALSLLHLMAYGLIYFRWDRVFHQLGFDHAREMLIWTLPVWLVSTSFWGDLTYLNIYIFMALLSTLLIEAVLNERLGWSFSWLSIILQAKPQWAFAIAIPLFLWRPRFLIKLIGLAVVVYGAVAGTTVLVMGPAFGWHQYADYFRLLWTMPDNFPYHGPDAPFLGYNHSVIQAVVYLLGVTPHSLLLAKIVKVSILIPLGVVGLRYLFHPIRRAGREVPELALDWAFALYLGAFIWLDMVWELSLGIVLFTYLLATLRWRGARILVWAVFLPYAILDVWRVLSFVAFGPHVVSGPFVLTDPGIYVPIILFVILVFYALLVWRLWASWARWQCLREKGVGCSGNET